MIAPKTYINKGELPKPKGSTTYDANHDGTFNVDDYAEDPRLPAEHVNGLLTPEDLIVAFSDGKEDDGNGYTDDISGWNFYLDHNDPATRAGDPLSAPDRSRPWKTKGNASADDQWWRYRADNCNDGRYTATGPRQPCGRMPAAATPHRRRPSTG